ncbi:metal ABC transporter substrate-binding protein [Cutibacterium sp. V947]|uniref:metal ABC transporter substrate-binding protein n=1 Tax=unclassified Cutibacterium TaxID=2649671 RepID=UPI003EDE884F
MKSSILRSAAAVVAALTMTAGIGGCSTEKSNPESGDSGKKVLNVVASTGYLGDAVHNIAPDAKVKVLVKPGGDPHTQELSTGDIEAIEKADVVVWTGHDMEHHMMDHFDKLKAKQVPAAESIPESDLLPWEEDGKVEGHDPHVWNSPDNWKHVVTATAKKLGEIDKANADTYEKNGEAYNKKIDEEKKKAGELFNQIPKGHRILITGHDAFNYLGKTYGIEIHATDFVSSESEMSAAQLDDLAKLIADKKIKTIFQDNLKNPEAIKHLKEAVAAKGGSVTVSDKPLYADSLGEAAPVDTYLGVFQYNAETITNALK